MKKTVYISIAVVVLAIVAMIFIGRLTGGSDLEQLYAEVEKGEFEVLVNTTGELQAENSLDIMGPAELRSRNLRFGSLKIQDLIPEGTVVEKGDYVARLDRSDADNNLKDMMDELEKREATLLKTQLDTTITLRNLRDDLINLDYNRQEAEITLEQSKFEPPTTIRQNTINLEKARRAYNQAKKNYSLRVQQAEADMRDAEINLDKQQRKVDEMEAVLSKFTIYAPASGMVIYKREWGGSSKRKVGSNISPWDLSVATLPDLSSMISKTYVNEIDISKVKEGQPVRLGVDAFPDKKYTGMVTDVANIGEQLPNTDAKVFEVVIKVDGTDPILRPSMTTSNQIITNTVEDALFVPLEAIHATEDSIPYVYTKNGNKQVVVLGESNENHVIIEQGLEEGTKIHLNIPEEPEKYQLAGNDLIEVIKERKRQQKAEEARKRAEAEKRLERRRNIQNMDPEQMQRMMQQAGGRSGGASGTRAGTGSRSN